MHLTFFEVGVSYSVRWVCGIHMRREECFNKR